MERKAPRLSARALGIAGVITALAFVSAFIAPKGPMGPTYTVNGLTCPFESGTPANIRSLVTKITQNARFLNAAEGGQFMFSSFGNITGRSEVIGRGPTIYLPDVIELGFYSSQKGATTCQRQPGPYYNIAVQVPIQDSEFNMTGAQIVRGEGPF